MKRKTNITLLLTISFIFMSLFFVFNAKAAGDITYCVFPVSGSVNNVNSTGIMCEYTGGELLLKRYWANTVNGVGVTHYTANAPGYDEATKTGTYFIVHIQDGTNNATIDKITDMGTTARYEYQGQALTVQGSNPLSAVTTSSGYYDYSKGFRSIIFGVDCPAGTAISCWLGVVYTWAQNIILILATGSLVLAGIWWMTSAGDPKRLDFAKRLIKGSLSAVLVLVLGRFFLTNVIGVPWL